MNTHIFVRYSRHIRNGLYLLIWFTGILLGTFAAVSQSSVCANLLTGAIRKSPSLIFSVSTCAARILIFYSLLRFRKSAALVCFLFIDAFFLGFCGVAIYIAVGEPAWLLRPLLLFSVLGSYISVWWLLLYGVSIRKKHLYFAMGLFSVTALINSALITPMLFDLVKYL